MNTLEPMNTLGQRIAHYRNSSADIPKIIGLAASGAAGKLVEVTSSEGDVVEITVE